jgi:hypothetical protein
LKKIFFILIFNFLYLSCISAQVQEILPSGVAPAGADVVFTERWLPFANPATLSREESIVALVGYENRYFAEELSDEYISIAIPTQYFNIGAAFNFFGYADYHEMMAALTVARRFGVVAFGVEFDYFNMFLPDEVGYRHAFTAQVGLQVDVTEQCVLGFRLFNPSFTQIDYNDVARRLPVMMHVGCNYGFIDDLDLLVEVGYVLNRGVDWAVGMEYRIKPELLVRAGARGSDYVIPSLGVGVGFARFRFDLMAEADFRIGMSLLSNLAYRF